MLQEELLKSSRISYFNDYVWTLHHSQNEVKHGINQNYLLQK